MNTNSGLVPLLDETGRFPDSFAPPSVEADMQAASDSATSAASSSASAQASALAAEQAKEQGSQLLAQKGNVSGTLDLTAATRNLIVHATMTGNITVALPASPMTGHTITLELLQDATGGRLLTIPGAVTAYGVAITPAPAANALTEVMCFWDGVRWHARVAGLADSKPAGW